ncbi:hypothetical protein BDV06DRAFT_190448, partial [Aspergillus oleicola]
MPFQSNGTKLSLDGKVDHVVFSGDPDELDTTFIILRAPHRGRARVWTLLRAMGMYLTLTPGSRPFMSRRSS